MSDQQQTAPAVPNMDGKCVLITGANAGIGEVTARELVRAGAEVILACRSLDRGKAAAERMAEATGKSAPEVMHLDLSNLQSVRRCADAFLESGRALHVLINNAGLAGQKGITEDGFELAFGVNHLGHFLFTHLLKNALARAATDDTPARVVNVASRAHKRAKPIAWEMLEKKTATTTGFPEYCVSKLANVLFSQRLAREWSEDNIHSYALHPGVVASQIWRKVPNPIRWVAMRFMITNEEGALTSLYCATSDECQSESGLYYVESTVHPVADSVSEDLEEELWRRSLKWTGL